MSTDPSNANAPKDIRCWACHTPCNPSFENGKWWYSMACSHELAMAYDHAKWEAEHVA